MSHWHPFDASGDPGTCIWCGRKLRKESHHMAAAHERDRLLGDYGDGVFCGLRCGYSFGLRLSEFGRRLQHKPAD